MVKIIQGISLAAIGFICYSCKNKIEAHSPCVIKIQEIALEDGVFPVTYLEQLELPNTVLNDSEVIEKLCDLVEEAHQIVKEETGQDYLITGQSDIVSILTSAKAGLEFMDGHVFLGDLALHARLVKTQILQR